MTTTRTTTPTDDASMMMRCCWTSTDNDAPIDSLCLGTGRFLRAVLVPALANSGQQQPHHRSVLIQPRGRSLLDSILKAEGDDGVGTAKTYAVDTVLASGAVETTNVPIYGAFSLGRKEDRKALFDWLGNCRFSSSHGQNDLPRVLGVGVTEAGLSSPDTPVMKDLYEILCCLHKRQASQLSHEGSTSTPKASPPPSSIMSVINTDNVPCNGDVIKKHMLHLARQHGNDNVVQFLTDRVCFHNSMVDRITSHRPGNSLVPRAEPVPAKALVVLDPQGLLGGVLQGAPGVVLRQSSQELQNDVELKLRVANGTHTALAHLLALLGITMTNHVINPPITTTTNMDSEASTQSSSLQLIVQYLDSLVESAIILAWVSTTSRGEDRENAVRGAWDDWRKRLWHPAFGLSTYFITQNGPAKGGIRLGPTVRDLMMMTTQSKPSHVPVTVAFAFAALLRWLTPRESGGTTTGGVYRGWLQPSQHLSQTLPNVDDEDVEYADGLRYNLRKGWYEFRCTCMLTHSETGDRVVLSDWLASLQAHPQRSMAYCDVIRSYLLSSKGGNLENVAAQHPNEMETIVKATATLYARMMAGDDLLDLLREMVTKHGVYENGLETSCSALTG